MTIALIVLRRIGVPLGAFALAYVYGVPAVIGIVYGCAIVLMVMFLEGAR